MANINSIEHEDSENEEASQEYSKEEKQQILYEYHDDPLGGHQGVTRIRLQHN